MEPIKADLNVLIANDDVDAVKTWRKLTAEKIVDAGEANAYTVWLQQAPTLMNTICPSATGSACRAQLLELLGKYAVFVNGYKTSVNAFVETLRKDPLLTFEYDFNRPTGQPTNSTFRLIGQTVQGGWTLTLNGAASIYNSTPSSAILGSSLLRDIQVASEASYDFSKAKKATIIGHSTASAAYYFQDQTSPAILSVTPSQPCARSFVH